MHALLILNRVILRSPYVGIDFLSRSHYKQMTGRAGRAGIDTSGESILVVQKRDKHKVSLWGLFRTGDNERKHRSSEVCTKCFDVWFLKAFMGF